MKTTETMDKLFLELSQFTTAVTATEKELIEKIEQIQATAYMDALEHLEAQLDKYAVHKVFILRVLNDAEPGKIEQYLGTEGVKLLHALRADSES